MFSGFTQTFDAMCKTTRNICKNIAVVTPPPPSPPPVSRVICVRCHVWVLFLAACVFFFIVSNTRKWPTHTYLRSWHSSTPLPPPISPTTFQFFWSQTLLLFSCTANLRVFFRLNCLRFNFPRQFPCPCCTSDPNPSSSLEIPSHIKLVLPLYRLFYYPNSSLSTPSSLTTLQYKKKDRFLFSHYRNIPLYPNSSGLTFSS